MATWQQGINSGGFLAGIGGQNSNAPKASDVSEALAYIRQNNEMERSGRNNIGLQALQGLGSVAQTSQAAKQQEADAAFQKEYAAAIQSGDRQQVRDLMTKYPGQLEKIQSGMKWADEDQRNSIGTLAAGARLAASSPEAMQSWLQNNAKELARVGVDPNNVAQMYQQNPSGFGEFVYHLGMAALGPIDYFNVQDKMAGREIDRGRLAETIRSNQAGDFEFKSKPSYLVLSFAEISSVVFILMSVYMVAKSQNSNGLQYDALFIPSMAFSILVFSFNGGIISKIISNKVMILLGDASFSFYLVHTIVISTLSKFFNVSGLGAISVIKFIVMALFVSLFISIMMYLFFEKPINNKLRKWWSGFKNDVSTTRVEKIEGNQL
ncbi:phage DNA ejection protein [Escherichia coli]|uniref:phage DNA ejection protein n=1 Tax=Escherichia coli TaxID=562 RepID=UPI000FA8C246|nr:phage DNA ejection protein [Escherichia coli]EEC9532113.1 acyltransferase [Escherichia coli]EEW1357959.1 acyltransferase [Escherichia coli]EFD8377646.1 acyltransferase [Escherichia coli]EHT0108979.1 phage DNA ejection protein [Escherichia coli]EIR7726647.1 phage DNA ejection protein [Escherichia coli]